MKKGFTLIELLVVVLIIGILSSVALPQYTKAVEKARATEAVQTAATLSRAIDIWLMENGGFPASGVDGQEMGLAIDLSGGEWEGSQSYQTKNFDTASVCSSDGCVIEIKREPNEYTFYLEKENSEGEWDKKCYTHFTEVGKNICKSMQSNGYTYVDNEI